MIRGPHQSADYVDQETSHADHDDAWDGRNSLTPAPSLVALLAKLREAS